MRILLTTLLLIVLAACSEWSYDTHWKSGDFRLIAIDTLSQMTLLHEPSSMFLVESTIFAVGDDEKHIVLKQHPSTEGGRKFDRSVTNYFIVARDKTVRGPLTKEQFDALSTSLSLPPFTKVFDELQ